MRPATGHISTTFEVVYCLTLLPLPEPFRTIIWVIVAVAIIIWLLEGLAGSGHFHALW